MNSLSRRLSAQHFLHTAAQGSAKGPVWLADVPHCVRLGFKGPRAEQWLAEQNLPLPAAANSWCALQNRWDIVARTGASEFFIETDPDAPIATRLDAAAPVTGVYRVLREDSAFVLSGPAAEQALLQVCAIDFISLDLAAAPLIMTLMADVAVLVVPQMTGATRRYRVWCDPSFGAYLWTTLAQIVQDCAGSIIGPAQIPAGPLVPPDPTRGG